MSSRTRSLKPLSVARVLGDNSLNMLRKTCPRQGEAPEGVVSYFLPDLARATSDIVKIGISREIVHTKEDFPNPGA